MLAGGAGLEVPEPAPVVLAAPDALAGELEGVEDTADATGLAVEVTEPIVEVTGLAVEVTGDVAALMVEAIVEPVDVCVGVRGGKAAVAACAGRENTSMIARIPAAASAACIATRAMRRATGCGTSSSHSTRNLGRSPTP